MQHRAETLCSRFLQIHPFAPTWKICSDFDRWASVFLQLLIVSSKLICKAQVSAVAVWHLGYIHSIWAQSVKRLWSIAFKQTFRKNHLLQTAFVLKSSAQATTTQNIWYIKLFIRRCSLSVTLSVEFLCSCGKNSPQFDTANSFPGSPGLLIRLQMPSNSMFHLKGLLLWSRKYQQVSIWDNFETEDAELTRWRGS